jgi:D-methionine transport system ATP-binding protein
MIHIEQLYKTYDSPHGRFEALGGISLDVHKGEIFGIIGPSGAGKSTLVQCINLLQKPDSGTIRIGKQMLTGLNESALRRERRRIGMIFQHFNLLSRRTVFENVALPLEIAGKSRLELRPRVNALLALVGLEHLSDRFPSQISGGQKQRVGIARALANEPDVLLSDEATSALDPETTHTILALLRDINRKTGVTVMMITHQMEVVREICDRVAVLAHGQAVEVGPTLEVFSAPTHEVTRAMVSAATASDLTESTREAVRTRMRSEHAAHGGASVRLLRLALSGLSDTESVLTSLAGEFGLAVHVVQARIEDIQGAAVGTLFITVRGPDASVDRAAQALALRKITVQEIDRV